MGGDVATLANLLDAVHPVARGWMDVRLRVVVDGGAMADNILVDVAAPVRRRLRVDGVLDEAAPGRVAAEALEQLRVRPLERLAAVDGRVWNALEVALVFLLSESNRGGPVGDAVPGGSSRGNVITSGGGGHGAPLIQEARRP